MSKKRYIVIMGVSLFTILALGLTYAWLTWRSSDTNIGINSDCFTINYSKGQDISNASLKLLKESDIISDNNIKITSGMTLTTASIGIDSSCNIEGYGILNLNVNTLSDAFTTGDSVGSLRYAVVSYDPNTYSNVTVEALNNKTFPILSTGSITSTGTMQILVEQLANNKVNNYIIIIYIDGTKAGNDVVGASLSGIVSAEANQGKLITTKIKSLYNPNTTAVNNSITYNLDNVNNLMEDNAGNIRHYGKTPNNYIYFNCETYPDTNCEKWRIIGVFDGKIKIIRDESIGSYSWDTSASTVNSGYGINEWSQADLMKLLNPGYESNKDLNSSGEEITVNNSLYWNKENGICYFWENNNVTTCYFTSTGLKNEVTRNKITDSLWYLGGHDNPYEVYPNQMYEYERGTAVKTNPSDGVPRTTIWKGKIGLIYLSDYGYAADLSQCNQDLHGYSNEACRNTNWLFESYHHWLLTPVSSHNYRTFYRDSSGFVGYNNVSRKYYIKPTLYLNSDTVIVSGVGSEQEPYRIN